MRRVILFSLYCLNILINNFCHVATLAREGVISTGTTFGPFYKRIGASREYIILLSLIQITSNVWLPPPVVSGTSRCPTSHAFSLNHGQHCCSSDTMLDDSDPNSECNGELIKAQTPVSCCPDQDYVTCPGNICSDRPVGKPMKRRLNVELFSQFGILFELNIVPLRSGKFG